MTTTNPSQEVIYFSSLFHATVQLHIDHFQASSYAKHIELESAYNELTLLMDSLIEIRQGESELVFHNYQVTSFADNQDTITYLERLVDRTKEYREDKSSNVQSLVDEILNLLQKTIYRLTFLK